MSDWQITPHSRSHVLRGNADRLKAEIKKHLGGIGYAW